LLPVLELNLHLVYCHFDNCSRVPPYHPLCCDNTCNTPLLFYTCVWAELLSKVGTHIYRREPGKCTQYKDLATGWRYKKLWFYIWQGKESYLFSKLSRQALGPIQPPTDWVRRTISLGAWWLEPWRWPFTHI
jgi:hypothetical protein